MDIIANLRSPAPTKQKTDSDSWLVDNDDRNDTNRLNLGLPPFQIFYTIPT